jgi:phosphatidylserine/phosphatidylglycerophosphate/cardiolipin synthase-like enzyme
MTKANPQNYFLSGLLLFGLMLLFFPALAWAQPSIEEAFSPNQGATALVVRTIEEARASLRVASYMFTSHPIAQALNKACARGVDVRIVFDKSQRENDLIERFFDGSCVHKRINDRYDILHDKFIIVDDRTLETGSFNFTQAAERGNAENVLVIHDDPKLVEAYARQWQKLWDEAGER